MPHVDTVFAHLGVFYYLLGNISPQFRSSLNAIQLVTVVKQSYIKQYGIDKVLEPFMEGVTALESVSCFTCMLTLCKFRSHINGL